jgi:hemerythrin-like domain-containing protein
VDDARFETLRLEHQRILQGLTRLEQDVRQRTGAEDDLRRMAEAIGRFLAFYDETVEPHMTYEEKEIYPALDRCLPAEVGSAQAMLREHETMRGLISLLRRGRARLAGDADLWVDLAADLDDLALLLRDHIRKEDGVINPLLQRLLKERVASER